MACSDENLASLLLKLSESRRIAAIVGETLERKLQPWLRSSQKCQDMLQCRLLTAASIRFIPLNLNVLPQIFRNFCSGAHPRRCAGREARPVQVTSPPRRCTRPRTSVTNVAQPHHVRRPRGHASAPASGRILPGARWFLVPCFGCLSSGTWPPQPLTRSNH
jgi:hypothetical protein